MSLERKTSRLNVQEVTNLVRRLRSLQNVEVENYYFRPFSDEALGYLGLHELLIIEVRDRDFNSNSPLKCVTFFAKSILPLRTDFDTLIFAEESKFFWNVMPRMLEDFKGEAWSADCYLVKSDLMVLEDLGSQGFKISKGSLTAKQLRSAVECVARFHASSMLLEAKFQKPLSQVYPEHFKEKVFVDDEFYRRQWLLTGIGVAKSIAESIGLDPRNLPAAYELKIRKIRLMEGERKVLCHGDLWRNNMMFKEKEKVCCRLVDFQMVCYKSYAMDLVELFHLNIDGKLRKKREKELIELYHFELSTTLRMHGYPESDIMTLEEIFCDVEDMRICGLVSAVQQFPVGLLNKQLKAEFVKDKEKLFDYSFISRTEFVMQAMKKDDDYRCRLEKCVEELIEYMQQREKNF